MRLLLDANLSWRVAALLRDAGVDAVHVRDFSMMTASDEAVMRLAVDEERVLVSEDADFGALLARSGSSVPSIVLVRTGEPLGHDELASLLLANLPTVGDELARGAIVVLAADRLRVRRLPIGDDTTESRDDP